MIEFHFVDTAFVLDEQQLHMDWLRRLVQKHNCSIVHINYIFCSDEHILEINKQYLDHDYFTDIISFPLGEANLIESDIFISVDRIKENALVNQVSFHHELLRVMAHGILHQVGFDDKTKSQQIRMRLEEEKAISYYLY